MNAYVSGMFKDYCFWVRGFLWHLVGLVYKLDWVGIMVSWKRVCGCCSEFPDRDSVL